LRLERFLAQQKEKAQEEENKIDSQSSVRDHGGVLRAQDPSDINPPQRSNLAEGNLDIISEAFANTSLASERILAYEGFFDAVVTTENPTTSSVQDYGYNRLNDGCIAADDDDGPFDSLFNELVLAFEELTKKVEARSAALSLKLHKLEERVDKHDSVLVNLQKEVLANQNNLLL
jgi:hypothetical protein